MHPDTALPIGQVLKIANIGRTKLYQLISTGALPAKKLGKRTFIMSSDLEAFLSGLQSYPVHNNVMPRSE